jgi:hypothetical protein
LTGYAAAKTANLKIVAERVLGGSVVIKGVGKIA